MFSIVMAIVCREMIYYLEIWDKNLSFTGEREDLIPWLWLLRRQSISLSVSPVWSQPVIIPFSPIFSSLQATFGKEKRVIPANIWGYFLPKYLSANQRTETRPWSDLDQSEASTETITLRLSDSMIRFCREIWSEVQHLISTIIQRQEFTFYI